MTPFSFIDAFTGKLDCDQPISRSIILRSTQLIICLTNGIDFLEFKPSEIAVGVAVAVVGKTQISALFQHIQKVNKQMKTEKKNKMMMMSVYHRFLVRTHIVFETLKNF